MSRIYEIADEYVEAVATLDPIAATSLGIAGHDDRMTDFSPDGHEARAALRRRMAAALQGEVPVDERDRVARDVMLERFALDDELDAALDHLRELRVLGSSAQRIRSCFDLMPRGTADEWSTVATRMRVVSDGLESLEAALDLGRQRGVTAARRQAAGVAEQAHVWAGLGQAPSFFASLIAEFDAQDLDAGSLRGDLESAAEDAAAAFAAFERYLRDDYLPDADRRDPVGADRYALQARAFNGVELDLEETYEWGWQELWRIQQEMQATAERIQAGAGVAGAIDLLESDPQRSIEGAQPFREWMQDFQDAGVAELHGTHFDIPEPIQRIEAMIAPPGGPLAMYYTGPSEDFSRPGRTWYPTGDRDRFPLWREVSVAYHEGVPGHHLQIGTVRYLGEQLSRYQRLMAGTSGYVEGWALYAERLMAELGYLENPDYYLGLLSSQALRAARVVVDIGMHLELAIPEREEFHPGETWTPEIALPFLIERSFFPPDMLASEVDRYLGLPGQAISYKVGEREWLAAREAARQAQGGAFDLKAFHATALELGPMGLAQLRREMGSL